MADAVATPTITNQWWDGKRQHVIGTISVSTDNYVSNGIACSFAGKGVLGSSNPPIFCNVNGILGYKYTFVPGTTQANGLLRIFIEDTVGTNTPLAQNTVAALTAVNGDTINFYAIFLAR